MFDTRNRVRKVIVDTSVLLAAPFGNGNIYGTTDGVKQTTVYLPDDLKKRLELVARQERRTEAAIVREALADALDRRDVSPTVPLFAEGWGDPTLAERVDELRAETGFGR